MGTLPSCNQAIEPSEPLLCPADLEFYPATNPELCGPALVDMLLEQVRQAFKVGH